MAYVTQLKPDPVYLRKIDRPDQPPRERWQRLGYPDLDSYWAVQKRLLQYRQQREERKKAKTWLFQDQAPGGHKPYMSHVWYWRSRLPERKGQSCRIILRVPQTNSIVVEFEDGFQVNTSRFAVRRIKTHVST